MSKKFFLSLLFVLALVVSCKNNTTNSTSYYDEDKNATITLETLNTELNSMPDKSPVVSIPGISTTKTINFPIVVAFNKDYGNVSDYESLEEAYVTPASLKEGLDKAFAGIQNGKINYEVTPPDPNLFLPGGSIQIITITLTPKTSTDTFHKASFRNSGKSFYKTIESNKIVCEFRFYTDWMPIGY